MRREVVKRLLETMGGKFSTGLGIDLPSGKPSEVFKWFLASIFFGARISETIASKTFKQFVKDGLLTAEKIVEVGWNRLVASLDEGGYVRYDFKTADKLLEVMGNLKDRYRGDLNFLHELAKDSKDLENRIKGLGKGIGEVTANIFLRELREIWSKADPLPQDLVVRATRSLGFTKHAGITDEERRLILEDLKSVWEKHRVKGFDFADFEASLVRLGKNFCRKGLCVKCPVKEHCVKRS